MRLCDLTGQRFGKLLVTGREGATPSGYALWRCRCDCGNEIVVESRRLRRGSVKDCGCGGKCQMRRDLTGRVFGQVTALEPTTHRTEDGDVIWKCRCGCGKEFEASSRKLLRGSVKDCGCKLNLTKKWIGRRFGDLTVVAFEGKKDHRNMWRCRCDCGNEVVVREVCLKNGHTTSCGCKVDPTRYCHFVDGTFVEAIQARTMLRNNTSGVRGVYLNQRTQRWVARIGFRGKTYYLGSFETLEDAKKARKFGEEMTFDAFLQRYREEGSG